METRLATHSLLRMTLSYDLSAFTSHTLGLHRQETPFSDQDFNYFLKSIRNCTNPLLKNKT